jgi:hypothetical protein
VVPALATLSFVLLATACSGSSTSSGSASVATSTTLLVAAAPTIRDPLDDLDPALDADPDAHPDADLDAAADTAPLASQVTLPSVESTGIPGLDSPDRLCAAWSRFAGSFQVVAVAAAFGAGGPQAVATLEVVAAPVATEAYTALFDAWPAELEAERDVVADQVLGPFQRRLADARAALEAAAGDPAVIDTVRAAWLATLAARDPASPEVSVDLGDAEWSVVDAAAQTYLGVRAPFTEDPSLVNDVATPLTDAYLAATCPDQGLLAGPDVVGG